MGYKKAIPNLRSFINPVLFSLKFTKIEVGSRKNNSVSSYTEKRKAFRVLWGVY